MGARTQSPEPDTSAVERFIPRPKSGLWDVTTLLLDFAIVTYAVEPEALARHLPPEFEPDTFVLGDGRRVALVSAVPFRDQDFRFGFAPFIRASMGQTNYRAYVRYRGERAVWFFGTSLDSFWVWVPRSGWKLPWHSARMRFETRWTGDSCEHYRLDTEGSWGRAQLELTGTQTPMGCLEGFRDEEETAWILTHPLRGFYSRRDGRLGTYTVWHERLRLHRATVREARFQVFEHLGLTTAKSVPHSVLVQQRTEFIIFLPPRPLV
ncbi:DUF2071 domain-containing protein [Stigmatella sp. ncwal1]|uniref:DUF2071 domain-containing protein n=1 Tax=Stigmatella ashevillensis TaxID=2995309 RepID=A0ABT5D0N4_9BACT|nr:DUF2071 domain-containing protein [Stigmatella ashevillena]MDC0707232.1 DUF2071 domain-containing protein [Stigmatella ashevillena]